MLGHFSRLFPSPTFHGEAPQDLNAKCNDSWMIHRLQSPHHSATMTLSPRNEIS
uniref:Uncharacterized protein n=1 Tax=Rhizophora mucronata TaxID=61149 RepID=A0A2P2KLD4_RHIMU